MLELWKDITGFEGRYRVSNKGDIISVERVVELTNYGRSRMVPAKTLKPRTTTLGYKTVALFLNGDMYNRRVHRLVAEAFIPNPNGKPEVNHIDSNRANNLIDNLEWCTAMENTHHSMIYGGRQVNKPQITPERLAEIKESLDAGVGRKEVCRRLGVSPVTLIKHFGKISYTSYPRSTPLVR